MHGKPISFDSLKSSIVRDDTGLSFVVAGYFSLERGQWRDSVSLARVDPVLNGYLEKSGEGKQEGCVKTQDSWPPTPHYTSWLKGHETEISTAGLDLKGLVPSYLLFLLTTAEQLRLY